MRLVSGSNFVRIFLQENGSSAQDDLNVTISASGRADLSSDKRNGCIVSRCIHAITISQPVQSWTVIRDHVDFVTLGTALSTVIAGIPECPAAPIFTQPNSSIEVADILRVRSAAQNWLTNVLLFPGARESPAVRQFLCYGANSVPTQYQGMNWITPSDAAAASNASQQSNNNHGHGVDDHELHMDDMLEYGDVGPDDEEEEDDDYEDDDYDDDAEFFSATERYQPTIEAVTQDDMMDLQNNADDIEMLEDVGSLAQSMGASHLGRSLQLQAELSNYKKSNVSSAQSQRGLGIGREMNAVSSGAHSGMGGIGNMVENAGIQQEASVEGLSDSFYQKTPISAPRLDSFKMIKVVGKGSFGTLSI